MNGRSTFPNNSKMADSDGGYRPFKFVKCYLHEDICTQFGRKMQHGAIWLSAYNVVVSVATTSWFLKGMVQFIAEPCVLYI